MSRNKEVQEQLRGVVGNFVNSFKKDFIPALRDSAGTGMGMTPNQKMLNERRSGSGSRSSGRRGASLAIPADGKYKRQELDLQGRGMPTNLKETESKAFRESPDRAQQPAFIRDATKAPSDPNNTGARGTQMSPATPAQQIPLGKPIPQMTYQQFMDDIGTKAGLNIKDRFESENLPATPGYAQSFTVNGREVGRANMNPDDLFAMDVTSGAASKYLEGYTGVPGDAKAMQAYAINRGYKGNATVAGAAPQQNAEAMGAVAGKMEENRQLTPGKVDVAAGKRYTQPRGTEGDERFSNFGEEGPDISELTGGISERGRAFLDAPMGAGYNAVRAAHGTKGGIRQGDKFFIRDSSQETGLQEVSRDAYYGVVNQDKSLKDAMSANPLATTPSGAQNPVVAGGKDGAEVIDDENTLKAKGFAANAVKEVMDFTKRTGAKSEEEVKNLIQKGLGNLN